MICFIYACHRIKIPYWSFFSFQWEFLLTFVHSDSKLTGGCLLPEQGAPLFETDLTFDCFLEGLKFLNYLGFIP
jgi:hypothetical protein